MIWCYVGFSIISATPRHGENITAYQAEVARRSRLTPEELAAVGPPTLLNSYTAPVAGAVAIGPNTHTAQTPSGVFSMAQAVAETTWPHSSATPLAFNGPAQSFGEGFIADADAIIGTPTVLRQPSLDISPRRATDATTTSPRQRRQRAATPANKPPTASTLRITNRREAILTSRLLVAAFQEAIDYRPERQHNRQPPALWIGDAQYLLDISEIVAELHNIVELLEASRPVKRAPVRKTAKRFGKFFDSYQSTLGHGAAALTVAGIGAWMFHFGLLPTEFLDITSVLKHK